MVGEREDKLDAVSVAGSDAGGSVAGSDFTLAGSVAGSVAATHGSEEPPRVDESLSNVGDYDDGASVATSRGALLEEDEDEVEDETDDGDDDDDGSIDGDKENRATAATGVGEGTSREATGEGGRRGGSGRGRGGGGGGGGGRGGGGGGGWRSGGVNRSRPPQILSRGCPNKTTRSTLRYLLVRSHALSKYVRLSSNPIDRNA